MPSLLVAADLLAEGAVVVVTGASGDPATEALCRAALGHEDSAVCLLRAPDPTALPAGHPAHGKTTTGDDRSAAYVCRGGVCSPPVTDAAELSVALRRG
jgi:uncharacterized protein YyaL (SSP411 family)